MTPNEAAKCSKSQVECCMCGDFGFSHELFHCKICQFRSQHKYCSNLYPKADCYRICNWCLILKEESKPKSPNSSNISTHKDQIRTFQPQQNRPIKKQRLPEFPELPPPPPPPCWRLPIAVEENIRRTRSEDLLQRSQKVVFRNKVRRYKLLDEVSS